MDMTDPTQTAFRALADPTRRSIICLLAQDDMTIAALTDHFDITRAAVKKHLTVLSDGGLITIEPRGRERINRLNPAGLQPVFDWFRFFDQFWDQHLNDLKTIIERNTQ
jgi:DNA-binding transcriptional ArsR family regulator